jgi:predicted Zn-dependent protease
MKKNLFLLLLTIFFSCEQITKAPIDKTVSKDTNFVVACKAVDTTSAKQRYIGAREAAAIPDFWDANYRSYRVCTLYVEAAYNLYVNSGSNAVTTENIIRNVVSVASQTSERLTGVKFVIGELKINTVQDPYYTYKDAQTVLYYFGQNVMTNSQPFKVFITDANIGGCAYISRGTVTSAKYAVVSLAQTRPINQFTFTYGHSTFLHELYHNLGLSHSHNDCAWLDKNGNRLGPLDSCYACENSSACPPTPKCVGTTKRMRGDIMSYCHLYGTTELFLKEPELAVLHKSLYYSTLPNYTPTTNPPPPVVTTPVSLQTSYKGSDGQWRIKFTVPINQTTYPTYALNVCRYDNTCTVQQACGSRGTITSLTVTEISTGVVDRVLSPQPSVLNTCYRTSVTCNNVIYWTPSYITN